LKWLRITYDASQWYILHNMSSTCPVWPAVGIGGQQWSRISSLNELVHFKAKLRDLGLLYQVMECKALLDKFGQVSSKVEYKGTVFVTVARYDRLGPYLSLHYIFWAVLALSVMFHHITNKEQRKRESVQECFIIIQNVLSERVVTNCCHI